MSDVCPRCGSELLEVLYSVRIFKCDSRQYMTNDRVTESITCKSRQIERLTQENAKLRTEVSAYQRAAGYWWTNYYSVQGLSPPVPRSSDSAWEKILEGACKAAQENAKLRESLASVTADRDERAKQKAEFMAEIDSLRAELAALRATAPYRVEQQQPAEVEQGEGRVVE